MMRTLRVCLWAIMAFGWLSASSVLGQEDLKEKESIPALFLEANTLMEEGFWHEAERVWTAILELDPTNAHFEFHRAMCLFEMGESWPQTKQVLENLSKGELTRHYDPFDIHQRLPPIEVWYRLAEAEHRLSDFQASRGHLNVFVTLVGENHPASDLATKLALELDLAEAALLQPTGDVVERWQLNTEFDESHALLSADGQTMLFASNRFRESRPEKDGVDPNTRKNYTDIYLTNMQEDSSWSVPEYVNVGLKKHAFPAGLEPFLESIAVQESDGYNKELRLARRGRSTWTLEDLLDWSKSLPEGASVAFFPDMTRLVVSTTEKRGEGGYDLFELVQKSDGSWSKPASLGPDLNTWFDEVSPFVAADGQSLFFSSNGLPGMGGHDVFVTTLDSTGSWTAPRNLGFPINSVSDDVGFSVGAMGKIAMLTSRRDVESTDMDVYEIQLKRPEAFLQQKLVVLTLDCEKESMHSLPTSLVVRSLDDSEPIQLVKASESRDEFHFILPVGEDLVIESRPVRGEGVQRRVALSKLERGAVKVVAWSEFFEPGKDVLDPEQAFVIDMPILEAKPVEEPQPEQELAAALPETKEVVVRAAQDDGWEWEVLLKLPADNENSDTDDRDIYPAIKIIEEASKVTMPRLRLVDVHADEETASSIVGYSNAAMDLRFQLLQDLEVYGLKSGQHFHLSMDSEVDDVAHPNSSFVKLELRRD